jgi:tyrosine-specific transport protein
LFSKICILFYQQNASTFTIFNIPAVLCAYLGGDLKRLRASVLLGGDLKRLRASVLLGSIVPLLALLVWGAIALGLSDQAGHVIDPV